VLIGIDAGGTSTRAVVLNRAGRCLGYGKGGGGNPVALGPALAGRGIRDAVQMAIRAASAAGTEDGADGPGAAVLAMAGASSFAAPGAMAAEVREISGVDQVEVVSDLFAMFASGTPRERGYVLVSGTGAAALRIENDTVAAAADGLGWLLGDAGSGFWIGHRAVRAALGGLSGHGPATAMSLMLQQRLGLPVNAERTPRGRFLAVEAAIETFYQMQPIELAKFASLAFDAARVTDPKFGGEPAAEAFDPDADPVAVKILISARERLIRTLAAVRVPELRGPVVLGGTVAKRLPGLTAAVIGSFGPDLDDAPAGGAAGGTVGAAAPEVRTVPDGVVGAAVLALRNAGVAVDQDLFDRVTGSLADIRR
jgi:N-acetylglucosamine kinase-like BadF-type ATPase